MAGKIVISGAGISGLLYALLLTRQGKGKHIYLVDKCENPGGLLRRFNYGEHGDFDYGMHNLMETGINALDELLFGLLPEDEWQVLEGDKRDLSGVFINGVLQKHSPYIDLRNLSLDDYRACVVDLLEHLDHAPISSQTTYANAEDFVVNLFGRMVAEKAILPSLEKIHKRKAAELDYMATIFTPMSRVVFCDEHLSRELTLSPMLRKRIAWSEQRTLPPDRSSGRRSLYPSKYGIYRIVDAIIHRLREAGVQFCFASEIVGVQTKDNMAESVLLRQGFNQISLNDIELLVWAANIPLLGRYLGLDFTGITYDKSLRTVVVNILLDRLPVGMGDLYYFFCYDPRFHTYRLTNFSNYCCGAPRNSGIPIAMELLIDDEIAKTVDLAQLAIDELFRFGITAPDTKIIFSKAEQLDSGFPMPSLNNIGGLRSIRNQISDLALSNLQLVGILAEDNLFFQTDVLIDVYKKVQSAC